MIAGRLDGRLVRRRVARGSGWWIGVALAVACGCAAVASGAGGEFGGAEQAGPDEFYGLWTLGPALLAITMAIVTRQVIPSLLAGIVLAGFMLLPWRHPEALPGSGGATWLTWCVAGIVSSVEDLVLGTLAGGRAGEPVELGHLKIVAFTLVIGGMVAVAGRSGGTRAVLELIAPWARSRVRGQVTAWFAGLLIFFDDYANAMIVGPTMRPVFDRLKISREKLAYIVDSTAAPVASIALVGTWLAAEVGYIGDGLKALDPATAPAFLLTDGSGGGGIVSAMSVFLVSLLYRFYPVFALMMVFLVAVTRRDFGPMLAVERAAVSGGQPAPEDAPAPQTEVRRGHWTFAAVPVGVLVVMTMALLWVSGSAGADPAAGNEGWWAYANEVLGRADTTGSILYGGLASAVVGIVLVVAGRGLGVAQAMDAFMEGMARMFPAVAVLTLAWALSDGMQALRLGAVATERLQAWEFDPRLLPLAVFVSSSLVSFATGTSWGTMGIICPAVVTVAAGLLAPLPPEEARVLFYASVGSVLAGAVFGDHCSPISDTTVLSALASDCPLIAHVWTQLPYAVVCALLEVFFGDLLCGYLGWPVWAGFGMGLAVLVGLLLVVGRRVDQPGMP